MKPVDLEAVALLVLLEDVAAQAPDAVEGKVRATERRVMQPLDGVWADHPRDLQEAIVSGLDVTKHPIPDAPGPLNERSLHREGALLQSPEELTERIAQDISDDGSPAASGNVEVSIHADLSVTPVGEGVGSKSVDAGEEVFGRAGRAEGEMTPLLPTFVASDGEVLHPAGEAQGGFSGNLMLSEALTPSRNAGEVLANELTGEDRSRHAASADLLDNVPKVSRGEERVRRRRSIRQKMEHIELSRRVVALEELLEERSGQHFAPAQRSYPRLSYPA